MTRHDITYGYARKDIFSDTLGTVEALEERQRRWLAGRAPLPLPEAPVRPESAPVVATSSFRSLLYGPDGKRL